MEIRPVRSDEYVALGKLTVAAYAALGDLGEGYADELAEVAGRAGVADVIVAVEDGRVLGGVTYVGRPGICDEFSDHDEAGIRHLAVATEAGRRGVGAALVEACIARARADGKVRLALFTTPWMTTAHRLYERAGFRRVPERDWAPEPRIPLLAYVLDLHR